MKKMILFAAALAVAGCATPDSVKLQASKIDALHRNVEDLEDRLGKVTETTEKALKLAEEAASKVETVTGKLKK